MRILFQILDFIIFFIGALVVSAFGAKKVLAVATPFGRLDVPSNVFMVNAFFIAIVAAITLVIAIIIRIYSRSV